MQPGTEIIVVVKDDGYGVGAGMVADYLAPKEPVVGFAVATMDEGLELRRRGHTKTIILFCYTFPEMAAELAANDLTATLWSAEQARELDKQAALTGCKVKAQIKLDTGMCRLGISCRLPEQHEAAVAECEEILALENLEITGIYTHFASSGWLDTRQTDSQYTNFRAVVDALLAKGYELPQIHCANSGATIFHPQVHGGLIRSGCMLYGIQCNWPEQPIDEIKHMLQVKGRVLQIRDVVPGDLVGYDQGYLVEKPMTIATLSTGYGDGIPTKVRGTTGPLINGVVAPVLGISMDQMMVDISGIEGVREGQIVTFAGEDAGLVRDVEQFCKDMENFHPGDFLVGFPQRVPRIYYQDGKIVAAYGMLGPMEI